MKKKMAVACIGLLVLAAVVCTIYKGVQGRAVKKQYEAACEAIFVTERNAVFDLLSSLDVSLTASTVSYDVLLKETQNAEEVCAQTFGEISDLTATHGAELVYYATFYRDVKGAVTNKCGMEDLKAIRDLLNRILTCYDENSKYADSAKTVAQYAHAMSEFYRSLSLLNEEMMKPT